MKVILLTLTLAISRAEVLEQLYDAPPGGMEYEAPPGGMEYDAPPGGMEDDEVLYLEPNEDYDLESPPSYENEYEEPHLENLQSNNVCNSENTDILLFFDAYNYDNNFKTELYKTFTSTDNFDRSVVKFSYFNKNNDDVPINDPNAYSSFKEDPDAALWKIPYSVPAVMPTPILNSVCQSAGGLFSFDRGTRLDSKKVMVNVIHYWKHLEIGSVTPANFHIIFNQLYQDLGTYPYFILAPTSPGALDELQDLLDDNNIGYTKLEDYKQNIPLSKDQLNSINDAANKVCGLSTKPGKSSRTSKLTKMEDLNTKYGWQCEATENHGRITNKINGKTEFRAEYTHARYEDEVANLYEQMYSSSARCIRGAEFELTFILDSTISMKDTGYGYQKNLVRKIIMFLPPCTKYTIKRLSEYNDGVYDLTYGSTDRAGVVAKEAIEQFDMYQDFEQTFERKLVPGIIAAADIATHAQLPHVTVFVLNGKPHDSAGNALKELIKTSNLVLVSGDPTNKGTDAYKNMDLHEVFDSPEEMWKNAEYIAEKIYCMKKRDPVAIDDIVAHNIISNFVCKEKVDFHVTLDPLVTKSTIDNIIAMSSSVLDRFILRNSYVRAYVNNKIAVGKSEHAKKTHFIKMLMEDRKNNIFVLPNRTATEEGRIFRNLILLANDKTYMQHREYILKQVYYGQGDSILWLTSDVQEYDTCNLELNQPEFQKVIRVTREVTSGGVALLSKAPLVARMMCGYKPLNLDEKFYKLIAPYKFEPCYEPADIAVLVDGAIPYQHKFIVPRFLNVLTKIFPNIGGGEKDTRLALYVAVKNVLNNQGNMYWPNDVAVNNTVLYGAPNGFNFNDSFNFEKIKNEFINTWAYKNNKNDLRSRTPSIDFDAAFNHVIKNGFTAEQGSRDIKTTVKQIICLVYDYSTLRPLQFELAKLHDITVHMVFLEPENTKLWHENEKADMGNSHLDSRLFIWKSKSKRARTLPSMMSKAGINYLYRPVTESYSYILAPSKLKEIPGQVCKTVAPIFSCDVKIDVGILIDGSASMSEIGFDKTLNFIKDLVKNLKISPTDSRVGILQYSGSVNVDVPLLGRTRIELMDEIQNIAYQNGQDTKTGHGIDKLYDILYNGRRANTPAIAIVLTDGKSKDYVPSFTKGLHSMDQLTIYAIGVGKAYNRKELEMIASSDHIVEVSNPRVFATKLENLQKELCGDKKVTMESVEEEVNIYVDGGEPIDNGEDTGFHIGQRTISEPLYKDSHSRADIIKEPVPANFSNCDRSKTSGTFVVYADLGIDHNFDKGDFYELAFYFKEIIHSLFVHDNLGIGRLQFSIQGGAPSGNYTKILSHINQWNQNVVSTKSVFDTYQGINFLENKPGNVDGFIFILSHAFDDENLLDPSIKNKLNDWNIPYKVLYSSVPDEKYDSNYELVTWLHNEYDIEGKRNVQNSLLESFICDNCDVNTCSMESDCSLYGTDCKGAVTGDICGCPEMICSCV